MKRKIVHEKIQDNNEYYILWNGDEVNSYCDPHSIGMEQLKSSIEDLKDNESSVDDSEITIYIKTKLKVRTFRMVEIYEDTSL